MKFTEDLLSSVEIDSQNIPLNMAFDNILKIQDVIQSDIEDVEKITRCLILFFGENLFDKYILEKNVGINEQYDILEFIFEQVFGKDDDDEVLFTDRLGNEIKRSDMEERFGEKEDDFEEKPRDLDLTQDAGVIYSSFLQAYGIDLHEERGKLHWFKFIQLLSDLPKDTALSQVREIRNMDLPKRSEDAKRYEEIKRLKEQYKLK